MSAAKFNFITLLTNAAGCRIITKFWVSNRWASHSADSSASGSLTSGRARVRRARLDLKPCRMARLPARIVSISRTCASHP
jgi:hypothetical protein